MVIAGCCQYQAVRRERQVHDLSVVAAQREIAVAEFPQVVPFKPPQVRVSRSRRLFNQELPRLLDVGRLPGIVSTPDPDGIKVPPHTLGLTSEYFRVLTGYEHRHSCVSPLPLDLPDPARGQPERRSRAQGQERGRRRPPPHPSGHPLPR